MTSIFHSIGVVVTGVFIFLVVSEIAPTLVAAVAAIVVANVWGYAEGLSE